MLKGATEGYCGTLTREGVLAETFDALLRGVEIAISRTLVNPALVLYLNDVLYRHASRHGPHINHHASAQNYAFGAEFVGQI